MSGGASVDPSEREARLAALKARGNAGAKRVRRHAAEAVRIVVVGSATVALFAIMAALAWPANESALATTGSVGAAPVPSTAPAASAPPAPAPVVKIIVRRHHVPAAAPTGSTAGSRTPSPAPAVSAPAPAPPVVAPVQAPTPAPPPQAVSGGSR